MGRRGSIAAYAPASAGARGLRTLSCRHRRMFFTCNIGLCTTGAENGDRTRMGPTLLHVASMRTSHCTHYGGVATSRSIYTDLCKMNREDTHGVLCLRGTPHHLKQQQCATLSMSECLRRVGQAGQPWRVHSTTYRVIVEYWRHFCTPLTDLMSRWQRSRPRVLFLAHWRCAAAFLVVCAECAHPCRLRLGTGGAASGPSCFVNNRQSSPSRTRTLSQGPNTCGQQRGLVHQK